MTGGREGGNGGEVYLEVCPVGMWEMDCAERLDLMLHNGPLSSLCLVTPLSSYITHL